MVKTHPQPLIGRDGNSLSGFNLIQAGKEKTRTNCNTNPKGKSQNLCQTVQGPQARKAFKARKMKKKAQTFGASNRSVLADKEGMGPLFGREQGFTS
jgi:predicted dienelactone hydrolase